MNIILIILVFGVIIFFHELGHFIVAKINHITVKEFSMGFGPKLFQFHKKETQYTLRLIPLGGYCMMLSEDDEENEKDIQQFIDMTEGMKILDLRGIREFKRLGEITSGQLNDVISLYKYGIKENPWDDIEREKLENNKIKDRIKGQDVAVEKSISIIKRAKTGFSGLLLLLY